VKKGWLNVNIFRSFEVQMNITAIINHLLKRKIATIVFVIAYVAAFAALGDGGKSKQHKTLLTTEANTNGFKTFSLKSTYNYRANNLFSNTYSPSKFIMLNTVITFQKGNNTYIMPLKKKVMLDKINFNPAR
jgi:hypothetical protein